MNKENMKVIILLVLLIGTIGALAYQYLNSEAALETKRQQEADAFAVESLKAIIRNWDPEALKSRAHPMMLDSVRKSGNTVEGIFNVLRTLGVQNQDVECNFLSRGTITTPSIRYAAANYVCNTEFTNSKAVVALEVRQDHLSGPWQIVNFHVDSPLFAPKASENGMPDNNGGSDVRR